jgi:hypothetical protein
LVNRRKSTAFASTEKKNNAYLNKDQVRSLPNFDLLQENGLSVSRELAITSSERELE